MAKKAKVKKRGPGKPMPIRWQQIIELMPQHNWQITPAALAVGYKPRYVESTLLRTVKDDARFCTALEVKKKELKTRFGIQTARLIRGWLTAAYSNIADFVETDADGEVRFVDFGKIPRETMAAVESIKITRNTREDNSGQTFTTTRTDFKLESRQAARESLGKIVGVFEADNAQRQPLSFNLVHFGESRGASMAQDGQSPVEGTVIPPEAGEVASNGNAEGAG